MKIGIIGGGAAGFFAAISAKETYPDASVVILEKSGEVLSKVKMSGGGRCNLTNNCGSINDLCRAYPRGGNKLKKAFQIFNNKHCMDWFRARGVPLFIQEDKRVFPESQRSQTIIDCFLRETKRLKIEVKTGMAIRGLTGNEDGFLLHLEKPENGSEWFNKVVVATGGSPQRSGLVWLEKLNHKVVDPVPSLFTFNIPGNPVTGLMGLTIEKALVSIQGTRIHSSGSVLITHWGMSGPAVLKLSSLAARVLKELNYEFNIQVNWANETNNNIVMENISSVMNNHSNKLLCNFKPCPLPERLWLFLLMKTGLSPQKKWGEIGKKGMNKLTNILANDIYQVKGKTTFREEFVTCGGVSLDSIDLLTMQSRVCRNLYFAGEVLDIDGITGGFNLQAAWTTGFVAGQLR